MFVWKLLSAATFVVCSASALFAQSEYGRYEVTPFFGTRFGGNIDLSQQGNPNVDYLKIKSSIDYGILADVSFWRNFAGLGFSHYGTTTSVNGQSPLGFSNRFAYNLGGGVKYYFSGHWGIRAELRWSPSHTTSGVAEYCDPFFGCAPTTVANKAEQGQANTSD